MKTYQHPETKDIKTPDEKNHVQIAALEKLGYVELTADDVKNAPSLSVTYETVTNPHTPPTPPALPKLTVPVPPGPTSDPDAPKPATPGAITREDLDAPSAADKDKDALDKDAKGDKK